MLVDLDNDEVERVGKSTAVAKNATSATAKYQSIRCEHLRKLRGLHGLPRLAFAIDLRSTYYRCAGGKHLIY